MKSIIFASNGQLRIDWPEHWINGGTGITRLTPNEAAILKESITQIGDPTIWLVGLELHAARSRQTLEDFWKFHAERLDTL